MKKNNGFNSLATKNKILSESLDSSTTTEAKDEKDEGDNGFERITKIELITTTIESVIQQKTTLFNKPLESNFTILTKTISKPTEKISETFVDFLEGNFL